MENVTNGGDVHERFVVIVIADSLPPLRWKIQKARLPTLFMPN